MSEKEIVETAELLGKLEPGFLPLSIFNQVLRLTVLSAAEIVALRFGGKSRKLEVLLTRRGADDPIWPNMWHIPGSFYRQGDDTLSRARAVLRDELPKTHFVSALEKTSDSGELLSYGSRGSVNEVIFRIWADESGDGEFFAVDELPDDFIVEQKMLIDVATKSVAVKEDE